MVPTAPGVGPAELGRERRPDNLAFLLQELFTVVERLRSNRQPVTDSASFRRQIHELLNMADGEARKRGYSGDEVNLAKFAVVAFLDESILNLRMPVFADWPGKPMQEELYGHHVAGEIFFQHTQKLVAMNDSQPLADLLEVFYTCLILGFAGRYSIGGRGELQAIMQQLSDKIHRIRRSTAEISPAWAPIATGAVRGVGADPVVKWLAITAGIFVFLTIALFIGYKVMLGSAVSNVQAAAGQGKG